MGIEGSHKLKLCLILLLFYCSTRHVVKGVAEISPSRVAPVCQVGDQVELTCAVSDMFLRWEFTVVSESGSVMTIMAIPVTLDSPSNTFERLIFNGTMYTISKLSAANTLPQTSQMTINPVNIGVNGTVAKCFEGTASTASVATTTIIIIDPDQHVTDLLVSIQSESKRRDDVTVVLKWTLSILQLLLSNVSIDVDPPKTQAMFVGPTSVQLSLLYNTPHNVSITLPGICGQSNQTAHINLRYSKCRNPMMLTDVHILGYEDPALEGQTITFICPLGSILIGCNLSMCTQGGNWEPDISEVNCLENCSSVDRNETIITAVISSILVGLVLYLIGCASGWFGHKYKIAAVDQARSEKNNTLSVTQQTQPTPVYEDLHLQPTSSPEDRETTFELKENIAYGPVRST